MHRAPLVLRAAALAALCLLCCAATETVGVRVQASGEASFSLRPVEFGGPAARGYYVFDARPGERLTNRIRITNTGTAEGVARVYAVDGTTGDTSGAVYRPEGDPRADVGAWTAPETGEVRLKPGEGREVAFTVAVPTDARAGQHLGGLVVANGAPAPEAGGNGFAVQFRTLNVLAVQVNLPGATTGRVSIGGVTPSGQGGRQTLLLALRNEGGTLVKPTGVLTVRDAAGKTVQDVPLALDTFVPGTSIAYPVDMRGTALDAGSYEATVTLNYGETRQETRWSGRFMVSPAQVQGVFAPQADAAPVATLVPPPSARNAGAANAPHAPAVTATGASPFGSTDWTPIGAGIGGLLLLLLLIAGAFALGQRRT